MSFLMGKQKKPRQVKPAQIDEARQRVEQQDDMNRRRGSAANILGGLSDTAPMTASARLLGGGQ